MILCVYTMHHLMFFKQSNTVQSELTLLANQSTPLTSLTDQAPPKSAKVLMISSLISILASSAAEPPLVQTNNTCRPDPLPRQVLQLVFFMFYLIMYSSRYPNCSNQPGLTGKRLNSPRKLFLMFLFSFEVDTLEIALKEQQDMLEKVFLVESTLSHKGVR